MIRRPPRSTLSSSSAASDVYKRQVISIANIRYIPRVLCHSACFSLVYSPILILIPQVVHQLTLTTDTRSPCSTPTLRHVLAETSSSLLCCDSCLHFIFLIERFNLRFFCR